MVRQSISVVLPAYNEEDNITKAVEQATGCLELLFADWEVIVVDDGSRDRTGEIIDGLARFEHRVVALHHPRNQGYGAALRSGIMAARKDLVFFCDSDLQFHISELLLLLTWIEQYDLVIGYRTHRADSLHRKVNAWGWKMLVRTLLGLKVRDIDCAFKLFRRIVFDAVDIESVGAMVNTEILVKATRMGLRLKEVPVTHFPRTNGVQTGAKLHVVLKAVRELFRLYFGLRTVEPAFTPYDRRTDTDRSRNSHEDRRRAERRRVSLPINFPDRRRRLVRLPEGAPVNGNGATAGAEGSRGPRLGHRVAMVVACPFPADHGTPGSIREMTEALVARGHRVHVVTYHFGQGSIPAGVRVHRVADLGLGRKVRVGPSYDKPLLDLLMVFKLIRVVLTERIDVIHAHNYEGALIGYLARLVTRRPLVYNAVNTMIDELPTYNFFKPRALAVWIAGILDHLVPRTGDRVVCLSDELADFVRKRGIPPGRVLTIPLGIDTARFDGGDGAAARQRYGVGAAPLLVYTGTLDRFQRLDYLMQATRLVADRVPAARLLIGSNLASEDGVRACRRMADALGLGEHVLVVEVPFKAVPDLLAAADVAVVPRPNCPGLPVKLLNYMAAGCPIVVFEGSAKGLRHLREAVVVPDHDWRGMGAGIVQLLEDRDLAAALGRSARLWAEVNLTWASVAARMEAVYEAVAPLRAPGFDAGPSQPGSVVAAR